MQTRLLWPATLSCILAAAPAPTAQEVLAKAKAAMGGAAWDRVQALETRGTYETGGMKGPLDSLEDLRSGASLSHVDLGGTQGANGFDGSVAWSQDASGMSRVDGDPDSLKGAANSAYMTCRAYWFPDRRKGKVEYARTVTEGNRTFHVLTVEPEGGRPEELWVDGATWRFDRTVEKAEGQTVTTFEEDYKEVAGLWLAFRTRGTTGEPKYDNLFTTTAVKVVPAPDPKLFALPAPPPPDFGMKGTQVSVPFEYLSNHVFVQVSINGKGPFRFFFDTGGLNILTSQAAARLGLQPKGLIRGGGVGENAEDFSLVKVDRMEVGDLWLERQSFIVMGSLEDWTRRKLGLQVDGIIGYEVLKRVVSRWDYPQRRMTFYAPKDYKYEGTGVTLPFVFCEHIPQVEGTIDGIPGKFTLDTGSGADVDLYSPFVKAQDLVTRMNATVYRTNSGGAGGDIASYNVRGKALSLGGATLEAPVLGLSLSKKGAMASESGIGNIGEGYLHHFNLVFDYPRQRVHLEPNGDTKPTPYDQAGMGLALGKEGWEVEDVVKGSPASEAGLVKGDLVLKVDGKGTQDLTLEQVRTRLREAPASTRTTLQIRSGGKEREVTLVLRHIL